MKSFPVLPILLSFCLPATVYTQIVWTEPPFPTDQEPVTVFFDATEGTAGLANCGCDVYLHTGLITSKSNSPSDWRYVFTTWGQANAEWKMEPVAGQPNVYSWNIAPNIRQRYNVTDPAETIEKLAFVFRNADGSLEGKADGGADIFYDVQSDNSIFTAGFVVPSSFVFTAVGETIHIEGAANQTADLSLFHDGLLLTATTANFIEYDLVVSGAGSHSVELHADNGTEVKTATFSYFAAGPAPVATLPGGVEPGINYQSSTEITFVLVAPGKQNVFLIGDFNDWTVDDNYQLSRTPDGVFWWITIDGLEPGQTYSFQYLVDGEIRIADPYSNIVLDPANDAWIPPSVF
ncbi:MAG TPA: hypothetical protein ENJ20_07105, partial [Bacteroidetes bacterium]|nr:hypothetical protein [Bacteroidota bacterium]